eukprot:10860206-Ditylum_brightwellii.AAC.1
MGGPCKYVLQDGADLSDEWLLEHIIPNIASTFSSAVSLVFALPILWDIFDDDASVSPNISQHIKEMCGRKSSEKVLLAATGHEGEVHLGVVPDADTFSQVGCGDRNEERQRNAGSGGGGAAALSLGHGDQV